MKLVLARSEFWRGIDAVLDVVPSKPTIPILSNILLTADGQTLTLAATDLDLSIRTRVVAAVHQSGSITVPARTLAEIVREWPDVDIMLEVDNSTLNITGSLGGVAGGGEGSYKLAGMPPDDFPAIPSDLSGLTLDVSAVDSLDADTMVQMIQRTSFAVSRDDTRPVLNGVLWRVHGQGILMVATDGHRFAHYEQKIDLSQHLKDEGREVIVPPGAMAQIAKLLPAAKESLAFTLGDSQLLFDAGHTQLLSRLIEGPYVDYRQVIPSGNDKRLKMQTDELLPAVRRVSILASSYTHQIRLKLTAGTVELSANSPEIGGDAREVIPVSYDGDEMDIGYNAQYLMEVLRRMGAKEVMFELSNQVTAALLRPAEQEEDQDYFCLLMPLRPTG
jgi:DNA polymerase III subunit beta